MKKLFLSLMVCTAFSSTTPGFCMESEVEEQQGDFSKLPGAAQLYIRNHIDDRSVGAMKCVSRNFKDLLTAERPQITLKIIYDNALLEAAPHWNTVNFSLFRSNEEYNTHVGDFSLTSTKKPTALSGEIDVPLFLLSGQTVKFLAEIREPFHSKFFKLEKFRYTNGNELTKSELPEGLVLTAHISATSNPMMYGDNRVSLFIE
jgi:hypothetical protein